MAASHTPAIILEYVSDEACGRSRYGYVNVHEGDEVIDVIILNQDARLGSFEGDPVYFALGIRQDGTSCRVYWDCLPGWEDTDNADDHCDWDKPYGAYDGLNWIY